MPGEYSSSHGGFDLRSSLVCYYGKVIGQYIARYRPTAWPIRESGYENGQVLEPRKPFSIPEICGIPADCLPLMVINWPGACSAQFLGLMANTGVLYANILEPGKTGAEKFTLFGAECYCDLTELFREKLSRCCKTNPRTQAEYIADIHAIYLVEFYREYDHRLRHAFPAIESLFISPPGLSTRLVRLWAEYEKQSEGH